MYLVIDGGMDVKCAVKQDRNEEVNFMLGSLLGSLPTILDENVELIATIEHRKICIYIAEIKGKDRDTWS